MGKKKSGNIVITSFVVIRLLHVFIFLIWRTALKMGKKKFSDKKSSVTFRLLHRSQKDPLVTDETAPQRVLQPVQNDKSEFLKYGIMFDDDYDYMQHLKERSNQGELVEVAATPEKNKQKGKKSVNLPSSVFQSDIEEKVGLLNRAAPQSGLNLDLDPDVVATLDDDFDFDYEDPDNLLEDDFVQLARGPLDSADSNSKNVEFREEDEYDEDEERDELGSLDRFGFEETKSCFTEYSMSSSVIRRNEQLTMLDDRFEEMFTGYDDVEIGALDTEEIDGVVDPDPKLFKKYLGNGRIDILEKVLETEGAYTKPELELADRARLANDSEDEEFQYVEVKEKEKWDCESILSTYSTIYNHPKVIPAPSKKIRVNSAGVPYESRKLTPGALAKLDGREEVANRATGPRSLASAISLLSVRNKDEDWEEKRARKKAFRQHKKERRLERKMNTKAFKEDKKRIEKMNARNTNKFQIPL